ncbi:MAG TPA: hypothetical protein VLM41_08895 [Steroidobacteraceae bacterium]|nr:hypothetical protein [Steroidobacteraceae bacterium]
MRQQFSRTALLVIGLAFVCWPVVPDLAFFVLSLTPAAAAIDPGRAQGYFAVNGRRIELTEAFAHLHSNREGRLPFMPELRIVLADRPVPQQSLAGLESPDVLELAREGQVLGLLIRLDPGKPGTVLLTVLEPPHGGSGMLASRRYGPTTPGLLENLRLSPQRVGGDLSCPPGEPLECSVHFSAPVFKD